MAAFRGQRPQGRCSGLKCIGSSTQNMQRRSNADLDLLHRIHERLLQHYFPSFPLLTTPLGPNARPRPTLQTHTNSPQPWPPAPSPTRRYTPTPVCSTLRIQHSLMCGFTLGMSAAGRWRLVFHHSHLSRHVQPPMPAPNRHYRPTPTHHTPGPQRPALPATSHPHSMTMKIPNSLMCGFTLGMSAAGRWRSGTRL